MITRGEVIKLKIPNHPNLYQTKHMYVTYKCKKGYKEFALCSTDIARILLEYGKSGYLEANCKSIEPNSPFDKKTYIELADRYIVEDVKIDRCLLTNPTKLYQDLENEFYKRFRLIDSNILIDCTKLVDLNKPYVKTPF